MWTSDEVRRSIDAGARETLASSPSSATGAPARSGHTTTVEVASAPTVRKPIRLSRAAEDQVVVEPLAAWISSIRSAWKVSYAANLTLRSQRGARPTTRARPRTAAAARAPFTSSVLGPTVLRGTRDTVSVATRTELGHRVCVAVVARRVTMAAMRINHEVTSCQVVLWGGATDALRCQACEESLWRS
jgi:hypothetical protein